MITSNQEYNELLYAINDPNNAEGEPYYYRIPFDETIYNINLDDRTIESPKFLSVLEDNNAEVIWFKVDRFHDDVDLFGATCWIQYKNALGEEFISVTIPQVVQEADHSIMYIPWPVTAAATRAAGTVEFSFQFFKMSEDGQRVFYNINTKSAKSTVLNTFRADPLDDNLQNDKDFKPQYDELMSLMRQLTDYYSTLRKDYNLYWLEA